MQKKEVTPTRIRGPSLKTITITERFKSINRDDSKEINSKSFNTHVPEEGKVKTAY